MKRSMVLLAGVLIFGFLCAGMVMAFPPLPKDLQMIEPDASLPKELAVFFGKWQSGGGFELCYIVEKIDKEKASLYVWVNTLGWHREECKIANEYGRYKLWFSGHRGRIELSIRDQYLDAIISSSSHPVIFTRIP